MVLEKIYSIDDEVFAEYGRKITGADVTEIVAAGKAITFPKEGSAYEPSTAAFEELAISEWIRKECFGELPTQVGYCYGHSNFLNAWEWHTSSEINIAVTDLVLILAKRSDYQDGKIDSSTAKAFLLKAGDMVEVYATTLHFCPCEVSKEGFGCVVALPKGTNTPLDEKAGDPLLFRKNKWLIAHEENEGLIARGVAPGIIGPNYEIKY
ncbi:MAG: DUF4867 family protein [Tyzzerella sp.]|nr:DUF4867 family protein [Tyzzerella sp.]